MKNQTESNFRSVKREINKFQISIVKSEKKVCEQIFVLVSKLWSSIIQIED